MEEGQAAILDLNSGAVLGTKTDMGASDFYVQRLHGNMPRLRCLVGYALVV